MNEQSELERLKAGIRRFIDEVYSRNAYDYEHIAAVPQQPHTLVIACADSRVDIETVTSSGPGDLFVTRNIGNMVPPYGAMMGAVSAVIEYAVTGLSVRHIAVCGHSDCGAMKAMLQPSIADRMPTVRRWLRNGQAAFNVAESRSQPGEPQHEILRRLTEENVLMQLAHLKTHPSVAGALARQLLTVSGWIYEIGSGNVRIAEDGTRTFVSVRANDRHSG